MTPGARYVYPDASIVCGRPEFDPLDVKKMTIVNPRVVVETLSDSTEAYDRGEKFLKYQNMASSDEYVLVKQSTPLIEVFTRQPNGIWLYAASTGLDASAKLRSVGLELPLSEVYAGVEFPPQIERIDQPPAAGE